MADPDLARIVAAAAALDPQPRTPRWASLSSCVVDAVWSIGANYARITVPVTRRVFAACAGGDVDPRVEPNDLMTPDPVPLAGFVSRFPDVDSLMVVGNRQRTSTRGGITKAEAVLRYVSVLADAGVQTRQDGLAAMHDETWFEAINDGLCLVPGEGGDGVRRGYMWMLIGDEEGIKPDRMVLRWLAGQGVTVDAARAKTLLREAAAELTRRTAAPITPWMVDHAVWQAGQRLPPAQRPRRQKATA